MGGGGHFNTNFRVTPTLVRLGLAGNSSDLDIVRKSGENRIRQLEGEQKELLLL